jgi:hypothetical protein
MLVTALLTFSGCKKSEPPKTEPAPDTAMVLPEVPDLEPLEDEFPDSEPVATPAAVKPAKPSKPANPSMGVVKEGAYTLQVGIFNTEKQAQTRAESLKNMGYPAYVTRVEDPTPALSGTFYRVRIGSFASSKAARDYGQINLAPQGIDYWADLKGRDSQPVKQVFKPQPLPPKPAPEPIAAPAATEPSPGAEPAQPAEPTPSTPKVPDW